MSAKEYAKELKDVEVKMMELSRYKINLTEKYLLENRKHKEGDYVIVHDGNKSTPAYIHSVGTHDDGEIFYRFNAVKIGGGISRIRFRPTYSGEIIIETTN